MHNSRRDFMKTSAGVGAVLALASQADSAATPLPATEIRTLFFDLSHEQHEGHDYYLMLGKQRYPLSPLGGARPYTRERIGITVLLKCFLTVR